MTERIKGQQILDDHVDDHVDEEIKNVFLNKIQRTFFCLQVPDLEKRKVLLTRFHFWIKKWAQSYL